MAPSFTPWGMYKLSTKLKSNLKLHVIHPTPDTLKNSLCKGLDISHNLYFSFSTHVEFEKWLILFVTCIKWDLPGREKGNANVLCK